MDDDVIKRLHQALEQVEQAYADWQKLRAELLPTPPDPDENPPETQENPIDDTAK